MLNTAHVMFVDVDQPTRGWRDLLRGLARWRRRVDDEPQVPERLTTFLAARRQWRVRVYRTRSGWRYLVVHDLFDPRAAHSRTVLQERFATCRFVAELGEGPTAAEAARVVELHDREARAGSDLPLA